MSKKKTVGSAPEAVMDMYTGIMRTGVFMEYKGRAIGLNTLNEKLRSYGV